ncbi:hypothetical protein B0T26DRAFT_651738 [Lasiosphaeria miniovina]|uniref:DUF7907 domain-containing protein n=1 Tax=Lasiosphaeria miniovina TaxID=1954250 RepID=A0AA40AAY2_9PEZI|nr:uncharacterized protein B0T26DRAFT_651738 [Lasiosphaeria miniovina]KAK0712542.1 hypothetical protein B0T26DRAFT_651738 [Lasiosphaeria miniovina]
MRPSTFLPLGLAALTSGTPLSLARRSLFPPTSTAKGFVLVANVTDLSRDLTPSIQHFKLVGVHVGAGLETAVLTPDAGRVLYENGTDVEGYGIAADSSLSTAAAPAGFIYPYGMQIIPIPLGVEEDEDPGDADDADYVDHVGIDVGTAQRGVGIRDPPPASTPSTQAYGPDAGTFCVCFEAKPAYGRPQYPVRFARVQTVDGVAYQQIPDGCAPIRLLAQCAALEQVPAGAIYGHDFARTVRCYDNVAAVSWS